MTPDIAEYSASQAER